MRHLSGRVLGIVSYGEDGRMVSVRADESSPLGILCKLGEHSPEIVYAEHRLRTPLRRRGPKGTYEFESITWEEAFEEIVSRLQAIKKNHGPEATAIYTGRGSFELAMCDIFQPKGVAVSSASSVLFPFGSPNTMGVGALCYVSFAMIAPHVTMGGMLINMLSDIENAELIVVWGANPATDCPPLDLRRILEAGKRGAKVVVIDPRRTMTAKMADAEWIPIRPGTDGALALGMSNVLLEEELYDESFAKNWTHGFPEFTQYAQHFRTEVVESITGVPRETVRSLALRIANARGASPVMYSGLEYSDSGVQAIRATMVLWALAGQLDVPGGRCFTMAQNIFPINREGAYSQSGTEEGLRRIELPLASPAILGGIKTSAVINVGTATLGALIGAGGYGQPILTGIRLDDLGLILEGAIPAAGLAVAVQGLFDLAERSFVPKGLRLGPEE